MSSQPNPEWEKATHRIRSAHELAGKPMHVGPPPKENQHQRIAALDATYSNDGKDRIIWDKVVTEAKKESPLEIKDNREAIHKALRESRWQHTKRVRSILP
jgi:hypothetical protein